MDKVQVIRRKVLWSGEIKVESFSHNDQMYVNVKYYMNTVLTIMVMVALCSGAVLLPLDLPHAFYKMDRIMKTKDNLRILHHNLKPSAGELEHGLHPVF